MSPLASIQIPVSEVYHRLTARCYDAGKAEDWDTVSQLAGLADQLETIVRAAGYTVQDDSTPA